MWDKDLPANPIYYKDRDGQDCLETGLTKREEFARSAMVGILSNKGYNVHDDIRREQMEIAVKYADELLKQLSHDH
jgi:hypothetical protein